MSTSTAVAYTDSPTSTGAGHDLGEQLRTAFGGSPPDAVVLFASSRFDYGELLRALSAAAEPGILVGSSSAGEFIRGQRGEGSACAIALRSTEMQFAAGLGREVSKNRGDAARSLIQSFRGAANGDHRYRTALVLTDALAGHTDELLEQLTLATAGRYQFAGGGAGDDAQFAKTHVFYGTEAYSDAVVALEFLSDRPVGIGVGHGWTPASEGYRVTSVAGARLESLNGMPAADVFEDHAAATGQRFDRANPLPFFLHNIIGIATASGYRLRVPLAVHDDGTVTCAAEIPHGATVHLMKTTADTAVAAAAQATQSALRALRGEKPQAAMFFDCVATRLRMGDAFGIELESVSKALSGADLIGCNTYGQIARAEGQFSGFHNCTAVVLVLPS